MKLKGLDDRRVIQSFIGGAEYTVDFLPKIKLEIVTNEEQASEAVDVISKTAHTGKIGDGKIFIIPVDEVLRIRTGEKGKDAL